MEVVASAVIVDLPANAIRLVVPELPASVTVPEDGGLEAILDVGARGRLLGLEVAGVYVRVMDAQPGAEAAVRSASLRIGLADDEPATLVVPRRGPAHEITYPSGNECWRVTTSGGRLIQLCATSAGERAARRGDAGPGSASR